MWSTGNHWSCRNVHLIYFQKDRCASALISLESIMPVSCYNASLSYPLDILACQGRYQEKSKPPFIPGLEMSGEVVECNECQRLHVGDRVFCIFSGNGAFSEECVVNEHSCFLVPKVYLFESDAYRSLCLPPVRSFTRHLLSGY